MDRSKSLIQIRPVLEIEKISKKSKPEIFQNNILRPILKFQHDILCFTFLNYTSISKQNFKQKHQDQKKAIITSALKSDHKLKSHVVHIVTSLMTIGELEEFLSNKSENTKRIISMAKQRLIDALT